MPSLTVSIDNTISNDNYNEDNTFLWHYVYADGQFEDDYGYNIVFFNKKMPNKPGSYVCRTDNYKLAIVYLEEKKNGMLSGLVGYIDDEYFMEKHSLHME